MNRPDPYHALAQAIGRILQTPRGITAGVAEFAASAMGLDTPAEIAAGLTHGNSDDADQLLDLLLFPDEDTQVGLEPLIEALPPRNDAQARLLTALKDQRPHLALHLPVPNGLFSQYETTPRRP